MKAASPAAHGCDANGSRVGRLWRPSLFAFATAALLWAPAPPATATEAFRTVARGKAADGPAEGGKLKWLPHRPSMPAAARATAPQHQAANPPARLVQHDATSPFNDPFGDRSGASKSGPGLVPLIPSETADPEAEDPAYLSLGPDDAMTRAAPPRTLAEELGTQAPDLDYECPTLDELKPIAKLSYRTEPKPGELPRECELGERPLQPRHWAQTTFLWKASALCHKPLYFEDLHLERYGHSWGPLLQPVMSGAHFFGNVLALPYKAGMDPPHECMYTLGYYRPGSCAPYMLDPIPLSVRGAVVAGGIWTGGVFAIP